METGEPSIHDKTDQFTRKPRVDKDADVPAEKPDDIVGPPISVEDVSGSGEAVATDAELEAAMEARRLKRYDEDLRAASDADLFVKSGKESSGLDIQAGPDSDKIKPGDLPSLSASEEATESYQYVAGRKLSGALLAPENPSIEGSYADEMAKKMEAPLPGTPTLETPSVDDEYVAEPTEAFTDDSDKTLNITEMPAMEAMVEIDEPVEAVVEITDDPAEKFKSKGGDIKKEYEEYVASEKTESRPLVMGDVFEGEKTKLDVGKVKAREAHAEFLEADTIHTDDVEGTMVGGPPPTLEAIKAAQANLKDLSVDQRLEMPKMSKAEALLAKIKKSAPEIKARQEKEGIMNKPSEKANELLERMKKSAPEISARNSEYAADVASAKTEVAEEIRKEADIEALQAEVFEKQEEESEYAADVASAEAEVAKEVEVQRSVAEVIAGAKELLAKLSRENVAENRGTVSAEDQALILADRERLKAERLAKREVKEAADAERFSAEEQVTADDLAVQIADLQARKKELRAQANNLKPNDYNTQIRALNAEGVVLKTQVNELLGVTPAELPVFEASPLGPVEVAEPALAKAEQLEAFKGKEGDLLMTNELKKAIDKAMKGKENSSAFSRLGSTVKGQPVKLRYLGKGSDGMHKFIDPEASKTIDYDAGQSAADYTIKLSDAELLGTLSPDRPFLKMSAPVELVAGGEM